MHCGVAVRRLCECRSTGARRLRPVARARLDIGHVVYRTPALFYVDVGQCSGTAVVALRYVSSDSVRLRLYVACMLPADSGVCTRSYYTRGDDSLFAHALDYRPALWAAGLAAPDTALRCRVASNGIGICQQPVRRMARRCLVGAQCGWA